MSSTDIFSTLKELQVCQTRIIELKATIAALPTDKPDLDHVRILQLQLTDTLSQERLLLQKCSGLVSTVLQSSGPVPAQAQDTTAQVGHALQVSQAHRKRLKTEVEEDEVADLESHAENGKIVIKKEPVEPRRNSLRNKKGTPPDELPTKPKQPRRNGAGGQVKKVPARRPSNPRTKDPAKFSLRDTLLRKYLPGAGTGTRASNANGQSDNSPPTFPEGATLAYNTQVAFRPPNSTDWIQCQVINSRLSTSPSRLNNTNSGKGVIIYDVQDPEPDQKGHRGKKYHAVTPDDVLIISRPESAGKLKPYKPGARVLARYPDTTTFYQAQVVAQDVKTGVCRLRFEGETSVQQVERRFVLVLKK